MAIKIRPATSSDLPQIQAINTHYILNTSLTFLQNPLPRAVFANNFNEISDVRRLPYLVAVESRDTISKEEGDVKPSHHETPSEKQEEEDLILGYSYLSPFRGHMLSYAPTLELSLFVHPAHQSRSIGSLLLASIISLAQGPSTRHLAREVTETASSNREEGGVGEVHEVLARDDRGEEGAKIRNILAVMAVDPEGKDGGEALLGWYIKKGFIQRGRMEKVGFKRGRWLDTIYLQYALPE